MPKLTSELRANLSHWNYRKNQMLAVGELKSILKTKPIRSDDNAAVDVFVLTSGEDLYPLLIALKSLVFWTGMSYRFNVCCDDGALKPSAMDVIRDYVQNVNLITDRDAILERIRDYPATTRFHLDGDDPSYPKLTMPALFAEKDKVILTDTDVVFFRKPDLLMNWANDPTNRANLYRNPLPQENKPYPFPELEVDLQVHYGIGERPSLESGLLLFHKDMMRLDVLEDVSARFEKHGYTQWTKELEIYNVLYRVAGEHTPMPREDYGGVYNYGAAAVHYFSKHMYIRPSMMHILSLIEFINFMEGEGVPPI